MARPPVELEQRHQVCIQTYNTTAPQGLLKDQRLPPIPWAILGTAKGRLYSQDELKRQFVQAVFPRTTNPYGCVPLHSDHFSIAEGVPKARLLLWSYGERLRALCADVILAEYHGNYDGQTRKVAAIHHGVFSPPRFASPQGTLVPLNPQAFLVLYRPPPPRRPARPHGSAAQLLLFELVRPA